MKEEAVMAPRPVLAAVQSQQREIERLKRTVAKQDLALAFIAKVAGVTPELQALYKEADVLNPAQPVPDAPEEAPVQTTEDARTPEAYDDPQAIGATPGANQHLQADTTTNPLAVGEDLPTAPFSNDQDVSAPVAGTNSGEVPLPDTRTEVEVRVGNPDDPQPAFPWTISSNRTMAALRLARLQIEAGIAEGDDITVAASIEVDASLSDEMLEREITTLERVSKAAAKTARPAGLVPRAAGVQRTTPSLASDSSSSQRTASASDADAEDIFL
jgi:hypothetical protein